MANKNLLKLQISELKQLMDKLIPEVERLIDDKPVNDYLGINEVAELLGVCPLTVRRRMASDPNFPQPYIKHPLRFRRAAVMEFITNAEQAQKELAECRSITARMKKRSQSFA